MKRHQVMKILNEQKKQSEKRIDIETSIFNLQNKRFDVFTVKSQVYDNVRVQGGLNIIEAEKANFREIANLKKELDSFPEETQEYSWIINSPALDPLDRKILNYYYKLCLTHRQIAEIKNCSHTNVQKNIEKAIDKLINNN